MYLRCDRQHQPQSRHFRSLTLRSPHHQPFLIGVGELPTKRVLLKLTAIMALLRGTDKVSQALLQVDSQSLLSGDLLSCLSNDSVPH